MPHNTQADNFTQTNGHSVANKFSQFSSPYLFRWIAEDMILWK